MKQKLIGMVVNPTLGMTTIKEPLQSRAFAILLFFSLTLRGKAQDSCAASVSSLPNVSFGTSHYVCIEAWPSYNYILRYAADNRTKTVSIVLSVNDDGSWYGIGFSRNGKMVPSSAIIGWSKDGNPSIVQYFLGGQSSDLVVPDKNMLKVQGPLNAFTHNGAFYLSFQVQLDQFSTHLIYAIGPQNVLPGANLKLQHHRDYTSTTVDFTTGASFIIDTGNLKRNHGALNIVGWGVLLPIGAIIARYFRQFDPTWFYLHVAFQTTAYIFAVAALALGVSLVNKGPLVNYHKHRAIGIFVFVMATLQMLAFVLRPKKEAPVRKYWNWYHHFVGSLVIFLAVINIYVGLNIANADNHWRVGYGTALVIIIVVTLSLEAVYWYKWFKQPILQPQPRQHQFQMQSFT